MSGTVPGPHDPSQDSPGKLLLRGILGLIGAIIVMGVIIAVIVALVR